MQYQDACLPLNLCNDLLDWPKESAEVHTHWQHFTATEHVEELTLGQAHGKHIPRRRFTIRSLNQQTTMIVSIFHFVASGQPLEDEFSAIWCVG